MFVDMKNGKNVKLMFLTLRTVKEFSPLNLSVADNLYITI